MAASMPERLSGGPRELPEKATGQAKADLPKAENRENRAATGRVIARARELSGLSLKEFADACNRDARQVGRWMDGSENPQLAAVRRTTVVRQAFLVALAECEIDPAVDVETVIRVRRRA